MQQPEIYISNDDIQLHSEEELREIQKDMLAEIEKDQILGQKQQLHTEKEVLQQHEIKSDYLDFGWIFWAAIFGVAILYFLKQWQLSKRE
jgi:hypothetical protein